MQNREKTVSVKDDNLDGLVSISALREEIRSLKEKEKYYEFIFNTTPDSEMVNRLDDGIIITTNEGFTRIFGYSREECVGKSVFELNLYKFPARREKLVTVLHEKGSYADFEETFVRKDGSELIGRMSARTFILDGVLYASNNLHDITEERLILDKLKESELKYRQITENMSDVVWITDLNLNTTYISSSVEKLLGETPQEHINKTVEKKIPAEYLKMVNQILIEEFNNENNPNCDKNRSRIIELEHYRGDGSTVWVSMHIKFLRDENGKIIGFLGVSRDINERKLAELKLEETKNKYETYVKNAPDGIFVTDEKMRYIEANKAASEMTGYSIDEILKMSVRDFTPDDSLQESKNFSQRIMEKGSATAILKYKHKNGTIRWWNTSAVKLSENRFLGFTKDITDEKGIEKELLYISYHDQLTGLYNRRFFEEELKRLDTKRNLPISIIMADLNGLKIINDSFGHTVGDQLLMKAADTISKGCRSDDIIARLGGDEFVVLLPKTDNALAMKIVNRIKDLSIGQSISNIDLSISFGSDTKTNCDQSILEVLALTENHMYKNKLNERASMRSKTIDIIMNTLYEKSHRELQHSRRVSTICEEIAKEMNLATDDVNQVRTAGLVHDIGKIGIDEKILNKAGYLSEIELLEIQKHPEIGWRILSSSTEFSELAQFILEHHEKWDGSGYPKGLKGEGISIKSRIISIADAYDAMTSVRSYRKGISKKDAIEEIRRCAGSHFDPQIASLFVEMLMNEDRIGRKL